jgi:xanthine dehydrogenase YagS FAD-binding subunit
VRPFDYSAPESASETLAALGERVRPLAGGTDVVGLLKAKRLAPHGLVDLKRARLPRGIETTADGTRIGALTTLSEIEANPLLAERHPALVQAAKTIATRQIRNRATLGGNLLQRPRCVYFRDPDVRCWLAGGDQCLAIDGYNAHHAIFGDSLCRAVHPSDLAGALLALDAVATLRGGSGERCLAIADLFAPPEASRRTETVIAADEILLHVDVPRRTNEASVYLKAMDRKTWAFALVGLALAVQLGGKAFAEARVVFTGVASVPWRHSACETALLGVSHPRETLPVVAAVGHGACALADNGYKVELAEGLLERGLALIADGL